MTAKTKNDQTLKDLLLRVKYLEDCAIAGRSGASAIIKDAEQHRNQAMYDRVQWMQTRCAELEDKLRLAAVREERVHRFVSELQSRFGIETRTDCQGNVVIVAPGGAAQLLPTGFTGNEYELPALKPEGSS